jgi:hypothetical protein
MRRSDRSSDDEDKRAATGPQAGRRTAIEFPPNSWATIIENEMKSCDYTGGGERAGEDFSSDQ